MRQLQNSLFITTPDVYLSLDGENIVLLKDNTVVARRPLHNIESITVFGYSGASPALMGKCAEEGISLCFHTMYGRFKARITGETHGNVLLRRTQYRIADNDEKSIFIAKSFIVGKLHNCKYVLDRALRDYPLRIDTDRLKRALEFISHSATALPGCTDLAVLRGIEGEAASIYFSVFNELILQQKEDFIFTKREKYPATDAVNALLSFAYSLLLNDCASAIETVGLDPYVGFLHRDRPGRMSLACDLMEELRPIFADRFILTLINKKIISGSAFTQKEDGVVIMDEDTKKTFLTQWQQRKSDEITHPYLDEKIEWGLIPYSQSLLLARFIRGDIDGYPPYMQ